MDPNTQNIAEDEDTDSLDTADRGDDLESQVGDTDKVEADTKKVADDIATKRDAKGRFKPKDGETQADEGDKAPEEEKVEEEADDDKNENFPIRLNRAKEQRDKEKARADAAEARAYALEQLSRTPQPPKPEAKDPVAELTALMDPLYEKVEEARADGDIKLAASLQRQIDNAKLQIGDIKASRIAQHESARMTDTSRYNTMADALESRFPQLVADDENYDQSTVEKLNYTSAAFEKMGNSASDALRLAAGIVMGEDIFAKGNSSKTVTARPEKAPAKPEIRKPNIEKAVETQKKQPPSSSELGINQDSTTLDPERLSDEDFDKLPDSKKRELRGDFG